MRIPQEPNYILRIRTDSYAGNFERELIAYSFGILDEIQMEIEFAPEYLEDFHASENMTYDDCYALLEDYLFERYQSVDDWEQMTFYGYYKDTDKYDFDSAAVYIYKLLPSHWEERIIRRIKKFFDGGYKKVYLERYKEFKTKTDFPKLISIELFEKGNLIKTY